MNKLSHRQQAILDHLIEMDNYVPASQIASIFNISEKTIYREIQTLRELGYAEIITHSTGKGFTVNYHNYVQLNLSHLTNKKGHVTIKQRREKIFINLLIHSPEAISIAQLSEQFYISKSSIFNDLKYIETLIADIDLSLEKNNKGTAILADEKLIREVLKNCVIKIIVQTNEYDLGNIENINLLFLQEYFSYDDILFAKELIDYLKQKGLLIEEPYDINLLTYIIISINRIRQKKFLDTPLRQKTVEFYIKELSLTLKNKIENYLQIKVPDNEFVNIYHILISSRYSHIEYQQQGEQDDSIIFIDQLINKVVEDSHFKNFKNGDLKQILYPHVKYLLRRLEHGISIHNPILEQIKKEFIVLFTIIEKALNELSIKGLVRSINENEIGYLTLYFQHILEQYLQKLCVIIVCSTGIGTSHLLKNRVMHAFPKWEIIELTNLSQIMKRKDFSKVDLILSTIKLDHTKFPIPVINVSVFLNDNDLNNIKKTVNNLVSKIITID